MSRNFGSNSRTSSPLVHRSSTEKKRETKEKKGPGQLSITMLFMIVAVGTLGTALGLMHINTRFETRDYKMETARLQNLSKVQHDDIQNLETELGGITRDSNLRYAATGPLGLIEPPTEVVTGIQLDVAEQVLFQQIETRNQNKLDEAKDKYLAIKEVKETRLF